FASPVAALVLQWHTKVQYITQLPVSYSMGIFAIARDAFDDLSPADQAIVREVMSKTMGELDAAARTDNERALAVLERSGIKSVEVDSAAVEGWRHTIEGTYPKVRARPDIDDALFDELLALLAEYRAAHR